MLRATFIALLALLAGAASACSDYVPPPGATLSGFVYYDANANGVRDSCDSPYDEFKPSIILQGIDPARTTRKASVSDGEWNLTDVGPGTYLLEVFQAEFSPKQTLTEPVNEDGTGGRGYRLSVKGYEGIEGLNFGLSADYLGLYDDQYGLYNLVFHDADADGVVDPDECPIGDQTFGYPGSKPGEGLQQSARNYYELEGRPHVSVPGIWQVTTLGVSSLCEPPSVKPPTRGMFEPPSLETRVFVGARRIEGTASVTVRVYNELNGDGRRSGGEPPIEGSEVTLLPQPGACLFGEAQSEASGPGEVVFPGLPAGSYVAVAYPTGAYGQGRLTDCSISSCHPPTEVTATTQIPAKFELENGAEMSIDFGFRIDNYSLIRIEVIEDSDGDGNADPAEPRAALSLVCYMDADERETRERQGFDITLNQGNCQQADNKGVREFWALDQHLVIGVASPSAHEGEGPTSALVELDVGEGKEYAITLLVPRTETGGLPGCTAVSC